LLSGWLHRTALEVPSRAAFGDVFNTGNVDVLLLNVGEPPSLLKSITRHGSLIACLFNSSAPEQPRCAHRAGSDYSSRGPARQAVFREVLCCGASYLSQTRYCACTLRPRATARNGICLNSRGPAASRNPETERRTAITRLFEGRYSRLSTAFPPPQLGGVADKRLTD